MILAINSLMFIAKCGNEPVRYLISWGWGRGDKGAVLAQ
jgi:hypothetical protein